MWAELRKRRTDGLRFRRQHPIGTYIVDVVCLERRLIVEIDGVHHGETLEAARDQERTAWLMSKGYTVFRAWNWQGIASSPLRREDNDGIAAACCCEVGVTSVHQCALWPR
jgi:very-short-patch-repair endonuclease